MSGDFLEKAKADYDKAIKKYDKETVITDILDRIAYFLILAGGILAILWACSIFMTILTSGWKPGEVHRVNILYPIALVFHATGLIYYGLPLAAVLAGGGYALLKYSQKRSDNAYDVCMAKKERYLSVMGQEEKKTKTAADDDLPKESDEKDDSGSSSYCYNCGKKLSKKHKYCPDCGTKVE